VVATGFDAAYFANRRLTAAEEAVSSPAETAPDAFQPIARPVATVESTTDADMAGINMDIKEDDSEHTETDFTKEVPVPNIWSTQDDENDDSSNDTTEHKPVIFGNDEDELEKPSFLRRLAKRRQKDDETDKKDQ